MIVELRIRKLREDWGLAQETVAIMLGCTQESYSRYENGRTQMPYHMLRHLSDYFNTSVDYLLGRTDETAPYPPSRRK